MDKTALFGKTFNTIGSTESNLILKTKGDLKILWGGKFIDLIKNGKIVSSDSNILKSITNADEIEKDGVYLVDKEVWVSISGSKLNITGGSTYISFLTELKDITPDLKYLALTNAGFYYETLELALAAKIKAGIIFISELNKLFTVKDGLLSEYSLDNSTKDLNTYFEEITIGELRIYKEGNYTTISSPNLLFWVGNLLSLDISDRIKSSISLEMREGTYLQSEGANDKEGYRLYKLNGKSILDIDIINLRETLNKISFQEVTYDLLILLINNGDLITGREYKIIDFQNSWEANTIIAREDKYNEEGVLIFIKNTRPIIVKARSKSTLELNSYYFDNPEWILLYDYTFNEEIQIMDSLTKLPVLSKEKGRIVYLKDEYNNEANYDFKHLRFFIDGNWSYTFSDVSGSDLSLNGEYISNSITIKKITFANEFFILFGVNKLVFQKPISNNTFKNFEGSTIIKGDFNNNTVYAKWDENILNNTIRNCIFFNDVKKTTFEKSLTDCTFKFSILETDIFKKVALNNCQFNNVILDNIELPDNTLINALLSLEPKLVTVIIKDSKLYLSMTSDSLLSIPSGVILMWAGIKDIPYGWAVCDGKNGTPNLLGRFIKAVETLEEVGEISSQLNNNNELTITLENLPKHSHPMDKIKIEPSEKLKLDLGWSDYNYGIKSEVKTVVSNVSGEGITAETSEINSVENIKTLGGSASGGIHSHTVSQTSSSESSSSEGEIVWLNKAIKIEPRAYALIFIMKL